MFLTPGEPAAAEFDLAADDVDGLSRRLVAAGVACDEPRDDARTGHHAFAFHDPDGNRVGVVNAHPRARGGEGLAADAFPLGGEHRRRRAHARDFAPPL